MPEHQLHTYNPQQDQDIDDQWYLAELMRGAIPCDDILCGDGRRDDCGDEEEDEKGHPGCDVHQEFDVSMHDQPRKKEY